MNGFQKNPFVNSNKPVKIAGCNKLQSEKQKLENIKNNMTTLKYQKPQESKTYTVNEKVDVLKNLDRFNRG